MTPVQVVLVNYKNENMTIKCLRALEQGSQKPDKVYVVDNDSCDSAKETFRKETFSIPIDFIWNKKNVGFAAGCNQGIKLSQKSGFTGFIWLLNNDTEPEVDALQKLVEKAESENSDITGSQIVDSNGNYLGGVGIVHPYFASVKRPVSISCRHFDYVEGSSLLISQRCLKTIGLLSQDFFLYYEENDYCCRAKKAGMTMTWATDSIIRHHIGSSTGSENKKGCVPFFIDCLMIRNRIHFAKLNGFPTCGIFAGLLISLCLRLKRGQLNRVLTIIRIISSQNALKNFIIENGGFYDNN